MARRPGVPSGREHTAIADKVELITYADRLGGDIRGLHDVLRGPLAGLFGGVHVLPFFQPYDGADAGFDPEDHAAVDKRLGTWEDVARLAEEFDLMVDVIVNHVSAGSKPFLDWLANGERSAYDGMFLTFAGVFPEGATEDMLMRLYRPRPGLPFTPYQLADGTRRLVWTTFTSRQIDVDVRHPVTHDYLVRVLDRLATARVRRVRLDAVGYAVKTPGQTSFMTPETFRFIDDVTAWCRERGLEVLVEVHSYYRQQIEIAKQVDRVYDFALPPLVLHALTAADADPLLAWMEIRPANAVTVLDTHDGIGVIDVGADATDRSRPGLLTPAQIDRLVEAIHDGSLGTSRRATGAAASNVDLYQVNCTIYDALGRDDDRYLLARAVQLLTPGVPQVYYVGLLAGSNDMQLLSHSNVGRDVNRHYYTRGEIEQELRRPVVRALLRLIRFRNSHPAFEGTCVVAGGGPRLTITWTHQEERVVLDAALDTAFATLTWTGERGPRTAALSRLP
ncbi:MAG TPA: sucrose phosphorylase [Kribbellaceae bacterium]|nr:sucrose phosphorylase [Kribbellaceae bacterium]